MVVGRLVVWVCNSVNHYRTAYSCRSASYAHESHLYSSRCCCDKRDGVGQDSADGLELVVRGGGRARRRAHPRHFVLIRLCRNAFHCDINEGLLLNVSDALVSTGLAAAGYTYVNIGGWVPTRPRRLSS
jgi:hypothetical protein